MRKIFFVTLVILSFIPFSVFAKDKMVLAVLDFEAKGVSDILAGQISELIRTEMINTGEYTVLERKQMGRILEEQEFQQTGCTEVSCAVQAGKLLSAHKILVGSVIQLGQKIIINGRIIDVEKGNADFAEKETSETIDDIDNKVRKFAIRLTKRMKGEIETNEIFEYHSPLIAGCVSILPFWSGSFNKGFNWWGLTFAISKTASVIVHLSQPEEYEKLDKNQKMISDIGFFSFCGFTIVDIIYSIISTSNYNKEYGLTAKNKQNVSFEILPSFSYFDDKNKIVNKPDGIRVAAIYMF